jgi:hypothetical protein
MITITIVQHEGKLMVAHSEDASKQELIGMLQQALSEAMMSSLEDEEKIDTMEYEMPIEETPEEKSSHADLNLLSKYVYTFLKNRGVPTSIHIITEYLKEEFNYEVSTLTNSMNWMMKHEPRIRRVKRGFYEAR